MGSYPSKAEVLANQSIDDRQMRIRVCYLGPLRNALRKDSEELVVPNDVKLRGLLYRLSERYGERFRVFIFDLSDAWVKIDGVEESLIEGDQWKVMVEVNDTPSHKLDGLETRLKDGDCVTLMLAFSGGG